MPAKKHQITDEERAKRIREAARELETSDDPKDFERAFKAVMDSKQPKPKSGIIPSRQVSCNVAGFLHDDEEATYPKRISEAVPE